MATITDTSYGRFFLSVLSAPKRFLARGKSDYPRQESLRLNEEEAREFLNDLEKPVEYNESLTLAMEEHSRRGRQ